VSPIQIAAAQKELVISKESQPMAIINPNENTPYWQEGLWINEGDFYNDYKQIWRCIKAHKSINKLEPYTCPELWVAVPAGGTSIGEAAGGR